MPKKPTTKKETVLSVLKEIRDILREKKVDVLETNVKLDESKYIKITFPEKTAKEIMDECNNKLGDGKFVWSTWMLGEDFFTKEKTRAGVRYISKDLIGLGKTWDECKTLVEKEGGEMLNMAELLWLYKSYFLEHGKYLDEYTWSWSNSRSSSDDLVDVGRCDSHGVSVGHGDPRGSYSNLGVRFFARSSPLES